VVDFLGDDWLEEMTAAAGADAAPENRARPSLVVQQVVSGAPGGERAYVIEVGRPLRFRPGRADECDVWLTEDYETAVALAQGSLSAGDAFMQGRMRIGGDLAAAVSAAEALARGGDTFASVRDRTRF